MSTRGRKRRSKTWLIDGFNTLHADPSLARLLQREGPIPACQALERMCHAWVAARRRTDVVIIFDGRRAAGAPVPTGRQPGVTSIYMDDEADAELMRRVRNAAGRDMLVTADRAIVDVGVSVGAEVLDPRRWLAQVARDLDAAEEDDEKLRAISPAEASSWLRAFGGPPATRPAQAAPPSKAARGQLREPGPSSAGGDAAPGASPARAPRAASRGSAPHASDPNANASASSAPRASQASAPPSSAAHGPRFAPASGASPPSSAWTPASSPSPAGEPRSASEPARPLGAIPASSGPTMSSAEVQAWKAMFESAPDPRPLPPPRRRKR